MSCLGLPVSFLDTYSCPLWCVSVSRLCPVRALFVSYPQLSGSCLHFVCICPRHLSVYFCVLSVSRLFPSMPPLGPFCVLFVTCLWYVWILSDVSFSCTECLYPARILSVSFSRPSVCVLFVLCLCPIFVSLVFCLSFLDTCLCPICILSVFSLCPF